MATLEEQMQQEFLELQKSDEQDDVTKKPVPTQNVTETKTAPNDTSLQDQMEQEFKQQDVATIATETYVEKQNNIVVSEDQLREQAALGLPYAGEYDDEEIKTIEEQTEENFSRTKKSIAEIKKDNEDMEAYLKEKGITSQEFFEQEVKPKLSEVMVIFPPLPTLLILNT